MIFQKPFNNSKKPKTYTLPVVPVSDIVIFPNTIVGIFVGRKKAVLAIEEAVRDNNDVFVVNYDGHFVDDINIRKLQSFGTICKIAQSMKLPDGTLKITFDCICRADVVNYIDNEYIQAKLTIPAVLNYDDNKLLLMKNDLVVELSKYVENHERLNIGMVQSILSIDNFDTLCDVLASKLPLTIQQQLSLLKTSNVETRMMMLLGFLSQENSMIKIQKDIKRKTDKSIEKNNREFYLQEQMKQIRKELGDSDNVLDLADKYEKKIEQKHLPKSVAEKVKEEINRLKYLGNMTSEAGVIRGYLDTIFSLPWTEKSVLKTDIKGAEKYLNDSHYGMEKAKERILESIAVQIKTGEQPKKTILCLYGAPGVGKTSLAEAMAKATGREFVKIALGGVGDEAEIRGHRKTYLGSMPGKIINAMKQAKTTNPLILLDEIDKIVSDNRGDPAGALLEVLDYQQNSKFVDHYLEVEYDLSNVLFVATANSLKIARPLLDRLELIKVPSYLEQEKFKIAKNFIIPRQLKENGLKEDECKIHDGAIMDTIKYYTREAGVRDLERKIAKLCRKSVMASLKDNKPVEISSKNLKDYLGVRKFEHTIIERKDLVGVVNGLAYTEVGGDILMIEAVKIPNGKGAITFTGELGNVMKESITTAFSLVKAKAELFGIDKSVFKNYDIHIHVPDGATPKDGPSAGITMVSTLVSLLTNKPVSKHLAMTGEISLRGAVLPIGGLREKLTSAVRSGVKQVIIPKDNEKDLEEIPEKVLKHLVIHPCERIEQVMDVVFGKGTLKKLREENKKLAMKKEEAKNSNGEKDNNTIFNSKKNINQPKLKTINVKKRGGLNNKKEKTQKPDKQVLIKNRKHIDSGSVIA